MQESRVPRRKRSRPGHHVSVHSRWGAIDHALPVDPDLPPVEPAPPRGFLGEVESDGAALLAVAVGGALGTAARYGVELAAPAQPRGFPVATFLINTAGAFLLGAALTLITGRRPSRLFRPFACVGLLGAWTTMSTLAVEADLLVKNGHAATAAGYLLATLVAGLVSTWTAIRLSRRLFRNRTTVPGRS